MAALIAVELGTVEGLTLLADHAHRHQADPAALLVVLDAAGDLVELPEGTRLAVPVRVAVRKAPAARRRPR